MNIQICKIYKLVFTSVIVWSVLFSSLSLAGGDESRPHTPELGYELNIDMELESPPELGRLTSVNMSVSSRHERLEQVQIKLKLPDGIQLAQKLQTSSVSTLYAKSPISNQFSFIVQEPGQYKITVYVEGVTLNGKPKDRYEYLFFTVSDDKRKNQMGWSNSLNMDVDDSDPMTPSERPDLAIDAEGYVTVPAADADLNYAEKKILASEYFTDSGQMEGIRGGSVTISGRYRFRNREDTAYEGFNRALMRLVNSTTGDHLAWTYADNNGYFTFPSVSNPGADGMRVRVYSVRYVTGDEGYGVCDFDTCVDNAAADTGTYDQFYYRRTQEFTTPNGNQNIGTYSSGYSLTNNLRALWIYQDMADAQTHLVQNTTIRGPFTAEWADDSTHGNHYHRGGNIHFKSDVGDGTNHTILHELGHNVMYNAGTFPAGSDCPSPHYINRVSGPQCAWTEGWASIFLTLVNDDPKKCYPPSTTNCTYFETEPSYDNCGSSWDCGTDSDEVEGHVIGAVWDIYDSASDAFDIETFNRDKIYNILETDTNNSFVSWWASWLSDGNSDLALNSLFQNDIEYGDRYDIQVYNPSVSNASPYVNETISAGISLRNLGDVSSIATNITYYRSTNSFISSSDTPLTTYYGGILDKGVIRTVYRNVSLDSAGTFWVGACFSDTYGFDGGSSNDCSSGVQVTVIDDVIFKDGFDN
ncbi:hypothetical protein GCM10011365_24710 [Marinicella pacifica]|uniref:Uncharacterized protein n=1 Tax=Marinicella pacifica TaxID=1171543 RepID=A0A917FT04_9GAMM|nr:hypothetical protein [Marinicella pacifica]GGG02579.1 hypothetical protein GCM10011365_24710 [Marinicella pacifica]